MKTAKVSSKGQISLPVEMRRALRLRTGSDVLLVQDRGRIVLLPADRAARKLADDLEGWDRMAAAALEEVWSSKEDEIWDEA